MPDVLTQFFINLNQLGFYNFLLPWLFTFAVVYGLLMKVKLFGEDVNKKVSVALAFVIAFFVTGFAGPAMAAFFISIFGGASIFLAGILVIILFLAMVGWTPPGAGGTGWKVALGIVVVIGIVLFLVSTGTVVTGVVLNEQTIAAIFVIIVIVIAMWFITKEPGKPPAEKKAAGAPGAPHHYEGRTISLPAFCHAESL